MVATTSAHAGEGGAFGEDEGDERLLRIGEFSEALVHEGLLQVFGVDLGGNLG